MKNVFLLAGIALAFVSCNGDEPVSNSVEAKNTVSPKNERRSSMHHEHYAVCPSRDLLVMKVGFRTGKYVGSVVIDGHPLVNEYDKKAPTSGKVSIDMKDNPGSQTTTFKIIFTSTQTGDRKLFEESLRKSDGGSHQLVADGSTWSASPRFYKVDHTKPSPGVVVYPEYLYNDDNGGMAYPNYRPILFVYRGDVSLTDQAALNTIKETFHNAVGEVIKNQHFRNYFYGISIDGLDLNPSGQHKVVYWSLVKPNLIDSSTWRFYFYSLKDAEIISSTGYSIGLYKSGWLLN